MNKPRICFAFIAVRYTTSDIASGNGGRGLANDNEHGKLSRGIKKAFDVTKARAGKLTNNAEWVFGRRTARVLGVVGLFAVVVTLLLMFLNWYVAPTKPSDKKDLVLALAQILGGTALLSGLYLTWRTLQVNREGQITERFTRAIEQLGATDAEGNRLFEVRLGGIYALERIVRESEEDYWPIMEVLTAYVRKHARLRPEEGQGGTEGPLPEPDPDIQAIITVLRRVLRRRPYSWDEIDKAERLDLRETNLSGAKLWRANLWGVLLGGADLRGANLSGANLSKVKLLAQDQLEETTGDEDTQLPPNLKPPAHWGVETDEHNEED